MTEVWKNLYVAGIEEVLEEKQTKAKGVTHIFNVASEIAPGDTEGYIYYHVGVNDDDETADITPVLQKIVPIIDRALNDDDNNVVMVHCWSGISRSTAVAAAVIVYDGQSIEDAVKIIRAKRPQIDIFPTYYEQTKKFAWLRFLDSLM